MVNPAPQFAELLARPDIWRGRCAEAALPAVASGHAALDAELPGRGWPRGAVTELLCDGAGQGELGLLLPALRQLGTTGWLLFIAPTYALHAPAWAAAGVPLDKLVVVRSPLSAMGRRAKLDALNLLWAAEQALRSDAPAAVVCWSAQADARAVRRLQAAAAPSHAAMFLFRPRCHAAHASAAPLRLALMSGTDGALDVSILKRRGPPLGRALSLTLPRPALWRPYVQDVRHGVTHGSTLARGASAAPAARRPSPATLA